MLEYLLFQLRKEYQYNTPARSRTSHTHLGPYWLPLQHWYLPSIKNNNIAITRTFPPYPLHPLHTHTHTNSQCLLPLSLLLCLLENAQCKLWTQISLSCVLTFFAVLLLFIIVSPLTFLICRLIWSSNYVTALEGWMMSRNHTGDPEKFLLQHHPLSWVSFTLPKVSWHGDSLYFS